METSEPREGAREEDRARREKKMKRRKKATVTPKEVYFDSESTRESLPAKSCAVIVLAAPLATDSPVHQRIV